MINVLIAIAVIDGLGILFSLYALGSTKGWWK
jgi:hypothetical protein